MKNTDCFLCSDCLPRTRRISVLGVPLDVKNTICSTDGVHYKEKPADTKLRLSILPTSFCAASCRFCLATDIKEHKKIHLPTLEKTLQALKAEEIIHTVSISGGEPFGDVGLLNEVISMVFDILGEDMEVSLNTNGFYLDGLRRIEDLAKLDAVHISRHHYDDEKNNEIFGMPMPTKQELKETFASFWMKDLFVLNCMLLKDYIHTPEDAEKMLDFAVDVGAYKVSFITPMLVNDYCKQQAVDYDAVIRWEKPSFLFMRGFQDYEYCRCSDGVYSSENGGIVEFYGRQTTTAAKDCDYCRGLVFGYDNHLRSGYTGQILL